MTEPENRDLSDRLGRIEGDIDQIKAGLEKIIIKLDGLTRAPGDLEATAGALPLEPSRPVPEKPAAPPLLPTPEPAPQAEEPPIEPEPWRSETEPERPFPSVEWDEESEEAIAPWGGTLRLPGFVFKAQFWLTLIGVLLMLLGLVYLYNYSVEQGWITSPMKVGFGLALGSVLLALGIYLQGKQRFFSQMLAGTGIAAYYLTGFAAFELYSLVPFAAALAWMGAVTLTAFILSLRDNQLLALVGTLGGLATPILLNEGIASRASAVAFIAAVLAGSSTIYFVRGWRLLLWSSFAAGWLSLLTVAVFVVSPFPGLTHTDKISMQAGVAFALLSFWGLPLLREALAAHSPQRWPQPKAPRAWETYWDPNAVVSRHLHAISVANAFIALAFTREIWQLDNRQWGWSTLALAAIYSIAFVLLKTRTGLRQLAYTQALMSLSLVTMGMALILNGDARFVALSAETLALHLVAWKLRDRIALLIAHGFAVVTGLWLVERLFTEPAQGMAIINAAALSELGFIAAAAFISFLISQREIRYIYQSASYLALLGWFLRELSPLVNGQGYVTVAWGACALALLIAGLLLREVNWRLVALITFFVVVAKLLLIDLTAVKAIWRVLLLIGFGALFLILGYFFQPLWRPASSAGEEETG